MENKSIVLVKLFHVTDILFLDLFKLICWCHWILSEFLVKCHLLRVSRQSRLSANAKGDNEMIPGGVHRSPGIYLTAEENPRISQLGGRLMKAVQVLRWVSYLQMTSVGLHVTEGKERKGLAKRLKSS